MLHHVSTNYAKTDSSECSNHQEMLQVKTHAIEIGLIRTSGLTKTERYVLYANDKFLFACRQPELEAV